VIAALIYALIYIVIICVFGWLAQYVISMFAPPSFAAPARMVVAAVVIIAILLVLLRLLTGIGGLP